MSDFKPFDPNASTDDNGFNPPPDGTHKGVTLTGAKALTSKAGNDGVLLELRTTDGYEWAVWLGFKSDAQAAVTWSQVAQLGIDPTQIADLPQLDDELKRHIGTYVDVKVTTSDDGRFRNSNLTGLTLGQNPVAQEQTAVGATANGGAAMPDTSDIPFAPSIL